MSRLRYNRRRAVEHLSAACPALGRFIDGCGPLRLKVSADDGVFGALSRAIVYQQLSGRAAATIYGRFADLFEDGRGRLWAATRAGARRVVIENGVAAY